MRPVLITGGAGFVGTNLAHRLLSSGQPVLIYDSLQRSGVEKNLQWLCDTHGGLVQTEVACLRETGKLRQAVERASSVFHFAAQVAVTTSLADPLADFEVNARGTVSLLEALRHCADPPPCVFTSTNKVYGSLGNIALREAGRRHEPVDAAIRDFGVDENAPLDFHSPYGCSKGAADQYVRDYARSYDLPALVFRMSCIYGPHQFGTEDQGWVAHFLIRALDEERITLFGDGRQVRDILFVEDLVDAFLLAREHAEGLAGGIFNIGGGPCRATSLLELIEQIARLHERMPEIEFAPTRAGDQKYFVSDFRRFSSATGWRPRVTIEDGLQRLNRWLIETRHPEPLAAVAG